MPTEVIEQAEVKPQTPEEKFAAFRAAKAAAATPEGIAKAAEERAKAAAPATETPAAEQPVKRLSGDERRFRRMLSKRDQELGALRAELEALKPKVAQPAAAAVPAAPKREDFASDEEFNEAKTAAAVEKALAKTKADDAQRSKIDQTLAAYNAQIAAGPERYDDWAETLAAGSGAALSVDLGKECPSLLWAITSSPYAADCFYAWLKDSTKLQSLIDTYKSGAEGPQEAIASFHRFEGRVGKDAPAKKEEPKPAKAEAKTEEPVKTAKPKPSAEAQVRGGTAAPDGTPKVMLADGTLNPAWKVWRNQQRRG
jgi:hypothetical protein